MASVAGLMTVRRRRAVIDVSGERGKGTKGRWRWRFGMDLRKSGSVESVTGLERLASTLRPQYMKRSEGEKR